LGCEAPQYFHSELGVLVADESSDLEAVGGAHKVMVHGPAARTRVLAREVAEVHLPGVHDVVNGDVAVLAGQPVVAAWTGSKYVVHVQRTKSEMTSLPVLATISASDGVQAFQTSDTTSMYKLALALATDLNSSLGLRRVSLRTEKHGAINKWKVIVNWKLDSTSHAVHHVARSHR